MLPLKRASPPYVAVSVVLPPARGVHAQLPDPEARLIVQPPPELAETVTVPDGVPVAGATGATVTEIIVGVPRTYGDGAIDVIVVVVFPFAVRLAPEALEAWTVLPPYEAVMVLEAFVEGVSVTEQVDVVEAAGEGAQVVAENVSPATLEEKETRPAGLDAVPAGATSATVAMTVVGASTVAGFGARETDVVVAREFTVRVTVGDVEPA